MSVPQSIIDSAKAVESWLEEQNAAPPPQTQPQFLIRIGYSNLYKVDNAVLFNAGMNIDADGSPCDLCRHRSPRPDWRRRYSFSHCPESAIQSQNGRRFS